MIRRRRSQREIPFSLDSFLDVVANVVGIIIKLILVVWAGARSYNNLTPEQKELTGPVPSTAASQPLTPVPEDPLQRQLAQHRQELQRVQARLLEQLRQLPPAQEKQEQVRRQLAAFSARRQGLTSEQATLDKNLAQQGQAAGGLTLGLAEIRERNHRLGEEIAALEKLPPAKKVLHFRTPVSRPVSAEELLFECRAGRVSFVDVAAFVHDIKTDIRDKAQLLRQQWEAPGVTRPIGPFQLRYTIERERSFLENVVPGGAPDPNVNFSYGLSEWEAEPVTDIRGEPLAKALADGSEFRHIIAGVDPQQTVVTFWVYPDSFALYRQLRDFLYQRDIEVAGRPLPEGYPIRSSRHGTRSRGQ